ncbi:MAG: hypothetical protein F6K30_16435 [Cyanothece sp. SIO2G6]|nr:hypothetical protein [Cyanothece sp. SIO2G6]
MNLSTYFTMGSSLVSDILLLIGVLVGPICLLASIIWLTQKVIRLGIKWFSHLYRLRTTPCGRCVYYTGCEELACAVNPCDVLTKAARDCKDFALADAPTVTPAEKGKRN